MIKHTYIFSLIASIFLLFACDAENITNTTTDDRNVVITVEDNQGNSIAAKFVYWWYETDPEATFDLECAHDECTTWILQNDISGTIIVRGTAFIVLENDAFCWDVYSNINAEEYIDVDPIVPQEATLVLSHVGVICE